MVRNTRSLVQIDLPPRYAQTILAAPEGDEASLYRQLEAYLRRRRAPLEVLGGAHPAEAGGDNEGGADAPPEVVPRSPLRQEDLQTPAQERATRSGSSGPARQAGLGRRGMPTAGAAHRARCCWPRAVTPGRWPSRWKTSPATIRAAQPLIELAARVGARPRKNGSSNCLRQGRGGKMLVFATFRRTLEHHPTSIDGRRHPLRHLFGRRIGNREGRRRGRVPRPARR